jgi:hypothetical protein
MPPCLTEIVGDVRPRLTKWRREESVHLANRSRQTVENAYPRFTKRICDGKSYPSQRRRACSGTTCLFRSAWSSEAGTDNRGVQSSTFQLHVSAFRGLGDALGVNLEGAEGILGLQGLQGGLCFCVRNGSGSAEKWTVSPDWHILLLISFKAFRSLISLVNWHNMTWPAIMNVRHCLTARSLRRAACCAGLTPW